MGKEYEFKIHMNRKQAEEVIRKMLRQNDIMPHSAKTKIDKYWCANEMYNTVRPNEIKDVVRLRTTNKISETEITAIGKADSYNDNLINWFFYDTEKYKEFLKDVEMPLDNVKYYATYKNKNIADGHESNEECEERISPELFSIIRRCYDSLGTLYFNKVKRCICPFICKEGHLNEGTINVDIDNVNDLYYFEIEFVPYVEGVYPEDMIYEGLEKVAKEFGLDPKNKDPRSWIEITTEAARARQSFKDHKRK